MLLRCFCFSLTLASTASAAVTLDNDTFILDARKVLYCTLPPNAVDPFTLEKHTDESYGCVAHPTEQGKYWTMLNAYRSGGSKNNHWKYTDNKDDRDCLVDWTYYGKDGKVIEHVQGRLTTKSDFQKGSWCALPRAQVTKKTKPVGDEGKTWAFCTCTDTPPK